MRCPIGTVLPALMRHKRLVRSQLDRVVQNNIVWKNNIETKFDGTIEDVLIAARIEVVSGNEYNYTYEYDEEFCNMPVITLEVLSDSSNTEIVVENVEETDPNESEEPPDAVHYLAEKSQTDILTPDHSLNKDQEKEIIKSKNEFLEYMTRSDGSVICKLCGEILQSRTHWYRHKYKLHVIQPLNPAPLFQCEQCLVYFKSRKGYIGHLASRHSDVLKDSNPVLTNAQPEAIPKETSVPTQTVIKEEPDPEMVIPKSSVLNYQSSTKQNTLKTDAKKSSRVNKVNQTGDNNDKTDWDEKRLKEEKLVAEIIDRVRRECEAQGSGGTRRGYTRRTTVMHT